MLTLTGVLVVVVGFALRMNPLLVVLAAGLVTGLAAGMSLHDIVAGLSIPFMADLLVWEGCRVLPVSGIG